MKSTYFEDDDTIVEIVLLDAKRKSLFPLEFKKAA
jgi:hypothetical protein